jgi:hypothetical protein
MLCPQILQLLRQLLFFLLPVRWEARSIKTDLEWSWMQPVVKYCYNSIVKAWNLLDLYCYTLLFTEISSKEVTCLFGHLVVSVYGAVLPKVVGPVWHGSPNICPSGYSEQERNRRPSALNLNTLLRWRNLRQPPGGPVDWWRGEQRLDPKAWWLQLASQEAVHHPSIPVVLMAALECCARGTWNHLRLH